MIRSIPDYWQKEQELTAKYCFEAITGPILGHFTHCIEKFDIFFKKTWPNLCDYWN